MALSAQPTIRTEVPNQTLLVAAYFAQPGEVKVSIGMSAVRLDASLVRCRRRVVELEFFQGTGSIEVQQCVIGKMLQRPAEHRKRLFAPLFGLAELHTQIGVRAVVRAARQLEHFPVSLLRADDIGA